jgi:transcriptional regulator with XRE-family HTH domain
MGDVYRGSGLSSLLNSKIDSKVSDTKSKGDIKDSMGKAAGISSATVNNILSGNINCPPIERLSGFAKVLNVSLKSLKDAAKRDGCKYSDERSICEFTNPIDKLDFILGIER